MNAPQTLRDLVVAAQDRHQSSGRQLAEMAQKHGFAITSTTINHLKAGTYKSRPSDVTIRALGWLAGVKDEVAFAAAGRQVPGPPLADELPDGVDNLSPKARKAVIDLLRVLVAAEESGGVAEAAPITHAGESPAADQERRERADDDLSSSELTTSSGGVGRRPVDMDEFKTRKERILAFEAEVDVTPPVPDVEKVPAYKVPQESILERDQQDADAEGSQLPPEED